MPELQSEFKAILGKIARYCLKIRRKKAERRRARREGDRLGL